MKHAPTLALLLAATAASAQDRADIDRTQITGNRELPKVLYIVPWKKPLPGVLAGRPVHSVLDEALAPVERDVLRREIDYLRQQRDILKKTLGILSEPPSSGFNGLTR